VKKELEKYGSQKTPVGGAAAGVITRESLQTSGRPKGYARSRKIGRSAPDSRIKKGETNVEHEHELPVS
jgi:hypothetical protein